MRIVHQFVPQMTDLKDYSTGLTPEQRVSAINQSKALKSIRALGNNWLLHPEYSGNYQPELHVARRVG